MSAFPWLSSESGREFLQRRVAVAVRAFEEPGLEQRLSGEVEALLKPQSRDFRMATSLACLAAELSILCAGQKFNISIEPRIWETVRKTLIKSLSEVDEINFQGRTNRLPWKADLSTAEVGVSLALALHLDDAGKLPTAELRSLIEQKCLRPILADWLEHETRIHALDTMGHNWWSVMVAGAGIMAVALGEKDLSGRIAAALHEWFRYGGNEFARKRRNFGEDGDFVESFHYADYGLYYPIAFSRFYPAFTLTPKALNERQIRGLAEWLGNSILPVAEGYPQQRFGDVQFYDGFMSIVWQTVGKLANDRELLEIAYRIRPEPHHTLEMLFWEPRPASFEKAAPKSTLKVYANSGMAFVREQDLRLTIRAGEYWGHNHLDAGSFVFHQNGETWIEDSGACDYGRPEYTQYYVTARAHNVAFAPALTPPPGLAYYEGMPRPAHYLFHASDERLKVVCADTGILSGGALARSHRWFFGLSDEAVLVWDDLESFVDQKFVFLLHSAAGVETDGKAAVTLRIRDKHCGLTFHANTECRQTIEPAPLGQLSARGEKPVVDKEGQMIAWESSLAKRIKFGLTLSTHTPKVEWRNSEAGDTECQLTFENVRWTVWFNLRADGRVMHENCIAKWRNLETDAYALIVRKEKGQTWVTILQGSFLRRGGAVLFGSLTKQALVTVEVTGWSE